MQKKAIVATTYLRNDLPRRGCSDGGSELRDANKLGGRSAGADIHWTQCRLALDMVTQYPWLLTTQSGHCSQANFPRASTLKVAKHLEPTQREASRGPGNRFATWGRCVHTREARRGVGQVRRVPSFGKHELLTVATAFFRFLARQRTVGAVA